ncbi:MAG: hypothetical protein ABR507_00495 [Actinomycetota bacterium]|nr:hypothetical protein [Actinomycetota bacterium]
MKKKGLLSFLPMAMIVVGLAVVLVAGLAASGLAQSASSAAAPVAKHFISSLQRSDNSPNSGDVKHKPPYCNPKDNKNKDKCDPNGSKGNH